MKHNQPNEVPKMKHTIEEISRPVRRRLKRVMQTSNDIKYARRAQAILLLHGDHSVSEIARLMGAARSAIQYWRRRYEDFGEVGLVPEPAGQKPTTVSEEVGAYLLQLIEQSPQAYGYLRTRWTTEMLAQAVGEALGIAIHASTVRRLLPKLGVRWNRARPTLCIKDPAKPAKMRAINRALRTASERTPVFYVDEADIDLNPRIGNCWTPAGQQQRIPTPGKNQKRYLAGALNALTGNIVWVEWHQKNSDIFILLLAELRRRYRQARRITLIADNYVIHKSARTQCFLTRHPQFKICFQPVYHPWVNRIELVWKQLHDVVTRNHKFPTMNQLMAAVRRFMVVVSPFPGSQPSMATL